MLSIADPWSLLNHNHEFQTTSRYITYQDYIWKIYLKYHLLRMEINAFQLQQRKTHQKIKLQNFNREKIIPISVAPDI